MTGDTAPEFREPAPVDTATPVDGPTVAAVGDYHRGYMDGLRDHGDALDALAKLRREQRRTAALRVIREGALYGAAWAFGAWLGERLRGDQP